MLKNSTVKIILAVGIIILIVAATFAYGNSQRQSQQASKTESSKPSTTTQSTSPSASSTSPTPSSTAPTPASSPAQSPVASATPQIAPPSGTVPQTGGEVLYALPVIGLGVLLYSRRQGRLELSRNLKQGI